MVVTHRGSDGDPKERFVHQQAGASGHGGSSYIDLVAFRERDVDDGWTGDPDGTYDERLYYCQNQHADLVALITAAGAQCEMARYSAYGVPFRLPVGDTNSDGDCDQADQNQVRDWALATPAVCDVRGDLDLDGDVDLTDRDTLRDNYKGVTLGRGVLSAAAVRNQRGVAGYVAAGYEPSTYLIRHRVFPSELGVWASRDPLGYIDSTNLHELASSNPLNRVDPRGSDWVAARAADIAGKDEGRTAQDMENIRNASAGEIVVVQNAYKYAKARHHGPDGGAQNALAHCVTSCILSAKLGRERAKKWGDGHEVDSPNVKSTPNAQAAENRRFKMAKAADLANNAAGRDCSGCLQGSGKSFEQACEECCGDRLRSGLLHVWTATKPNTVAAKPKTRPTGGAHSMFGPSKYWRFGE